MTQPVTTNLYVLAGQFMGWGPQRDDSGAVLDGDSWVAFWPPGCEWRKTLVRAGEVAGSIALSTSLSGQRATEQLDVRWEPPADSSIEFAGFVEKAVSRRVAQGELLDEEMRALLAQIEEWRESQAEMAAEDAEEANGSPLTT